VLSRDVRSVTYPNAADNVKVLLTAAIQNPPTTPAGNDFAGGHPVSWMHTFEGGRSFYIAIGHNDPTFADPTFAEFMARGIEWAGGSVSDGGTYPLTDARPDAPARIDAAADTGVPVDGAPPADSTAIRPPQTGDATAEIGSPAAAEAGAGGGTVAGDAAHGGAPTAVVDAGSVPGQGAAADPTDSASQGGCSCTSYGRSRSATGGWLFAVAIALAGRRRDRSKGVRS
jgi:hypothetical protein